MTAKEIFEELGYELKFENEWNIKYQIEIMKNPFWKSPITIDFKINGDNQIYKYDGNKKAFPITYKELEAINKQIEELGWNNE